MITSLPDTSELPQLSFEAWQTWFIEAAAAVMRWVPESGVAIFFQSDVRRGARWVDKAHLVLRAADSLEAELVWHKIVCRLPPGTPTLGRASYSHLLCVSRRPREMSRHASPDVLADAGYKPWSRAMGVAACRLACNYLKQDVRATLVVDPFCGHGTVLAVANALGLDALGVELSPRRCRAARALVVAASELAPGGPERLA